MAKKLTKAEYIEMASFEFLLVDIDTGEIIAEGHNEEYLLPSAQETLKDDLSVFLAIYKRVGIIDS